MHIDIIYVYMLHIPTAFDVFYCDKSVHSLTIAVENIVIEHFLTFVVFCINLQL